MRWVIASDHAGYPLKEELKALLRARGIEATDLGAHDTQRTDYPDWGHKLGEVIARGDFDRGVLVCGTGIGISIAANRHAGCRAALCNEVFMARMARAHNDANVLALGARVVGLGVAEAILDAFLTTAFEGGRHGDRVQKIDPGP
jgi:ribose 5-phosphate isomerase B